MAHFAQLDENNIVIRVTVVSDSDTCDSQGVECEEIGIGICKKRYGSSTRWVQTSYNDNFRVRYAGIGSKYDENLNAFVLPKPYDSWVFNESTADWEPPVGPRPELTQEELDARKLYYWDEENQQWALGDA